MYPIDDEDEIELRALPRWTFRRVAVRTFGFLAIGAAFFGCATVLANPRAGREVLRWVTLDHAAPVVGAADRAGDLVRSVTDDK